MSWLFSRALVAAFSPASCLGGEPSAQLNVMPTPQPFWRIGRTKGADKPAFSTHSQFGLTCERLTADRGAELLMSYLAAFHVRTSASPEAKRGLTENDPACGWKWRASFAKYDPLTHGWKTRQISLIADSAECSPTWPRSGSMRDGECSAQATLVRGTSGTASGSRLPTLTVCGNYNRKGASATSGNGLATALRKMPTLCASDIRDRGGPSTPAVSRRIAKGKQVMLSMLVDGPLNPTWCEWFMGFPMRWTALGGSATRKSQSLPQPRGAGFRSKAA